jgi:hypothetical protein
MSGSVFAGTQTDATRLEYGATVTGVITDATPGVLYAFVAQQGDRITVTMNRVDGNLDSRVAILNADQNPLTSDDDGGGNQNSRIEGFTIASTGVYYLLATRYNGTQGDPNTSGTYSLTLSLTD